jgi:hypothetical protein
MEGRTAMKKVAVVLALAGAIPFSLAVRAQQAPGDGPRYTNGTSLLRPTDYREWIVLSSGPHMTDTPAGVTGEPHRFTNVFVNPSSYRGFMQTGKWPDGTIFVLEVRDSDSESSINTGGRLQTGVGGLEVHVKDSRFPGGWAFFAGTSEPAWAPLSPEKAISCVECHTRNGAVEQTFVQVYPTLIEVARQKGTLKPGN